MHVFRSLGSSVHNSRESRYRITTSTVSLDEMYKLRPYKGVPVTPNKISLILESYSILQSEQKEKYMV